MKCQKCHCEIPVERLEILPETKTCVNCSATDKLIGFTVWDKGTPILLTLVAEKVDQIIQLEKIDGRLNRL